jgi:hypothetical protein
MFYASGETDNMDAKGRSNAARMPAAVDVIFPHGECT